MNKLLFFTYCSLLLTTSMESMNPRALFNNVSLFRKIVRHCQPASTNKLDHRQLPNFCPDVVGTALALALHEKNKNDISSILMHELSDPNYIVSPELIALIKNTNQSERKHFSKMKDHLTSNQPEGIPAYYFAQDKESANECQKYGVNLSLEYTIPTEYGIKHGNILPYIIDNTDYMADLIEYYLTKGAGPYAQSYASNGGNTLHHAVHMYSMSNDQNTNRFYECAFHLVNFEPNLLTDRDRHGKTPNDCLKAIITRDQDRKDAATFLTFLKLFEHYSPTANVKKIKE